MYNINMSYVINFYIQMPTFEQMKEAFTKMIYERSDKSITLGEAKLRRFYCVDQAQINAKNSLQQNMDTFIYEELVRSVKDMHFKEVLPDYQTDIKKYIKA